jgi:hypothetical protein
MGKPLPPVPFNPMAPGVLRLYLLELKRSAETQGEAVANTSDVSDTATKLNALLAELRSTGVIKT